MVPGIIHIFVRNYMDKFLGDLLEMQELADIISCVLLMSKKKSIYNLVMMAEAAGVIHYHKIQQKEHWFCSLQPYI